MAGSVARERLRALWERSPVVEPAPSHRFVILSDLHLGDGSAADDCIHNEHLLTACLERHYLERGYRLVLNGDIEELYRFSIRGIRDRWKGLFDVIGTFAERTALHKLAGNHDAVLARPSQDADHLGPVHDALRIHLGGIRLFVLHGHQASKLWDRMYRPGCFFFKYVGNPLRIHNSGVSHDSAKRYEIEKRVYDFALENKLIAVMGHTHRPLFESLSIIDSLKFKIEHLCRSYARAEGEARRELEGKIRRTHEKLCHTLEKDRANGSRSSLYNADNLVPCVFNSGCAVGKRGLTAIEVEDGDIRLVHWFDQRRSTRFFGLNGAEPRKLEDTEFYRVTLKSESLRYIDARIQLLT